KHSQSRLRQFLTFCFPRMRACVALGAYDMNASSRPEIDLGEEGRLRERLNTLETLFAIVLLGMTGCHAAARNVEPLVVRMATMGLGRLTTPLAGALQKVVPDHFPA